MAKTRKASRLNEQAEERRKVGEPSTGNHDLGSDDYQNMAASQENVSDGSGFNLPSSMQRVLEQKDDEIPQEKNGAPISNKNQDSELEDRHDGIPQQTVLSTGPGSRSLPPKAYCFKKTLNQQAVDRESARLYLDHYEASTIIKHLKIVDNPPISILYPRSLVVFDELDKQWEMQISRCVYGGNVCYKTAGQCKQFVATHNLRNGEKITFHKNLDTCICDDRYYVIKIATKR